MVTLTFFSITHDLVQARYISVLTTWIFLHSDLSGYAEGSGEEVKNLYLCQKGTQ